MQADIPRGLIHGDPFIDNLLVRELTGEVVGWVDWEDVACGPLLFDVGCSIIGCCYRSAEGEDNKLDLPRLKVVHCCSHACTDLDLFMPRSCSFPTLPPLATECM
jgi:aminoglycoside phosphotransferase (APT) family kinase protein